MKMPSAKSSLPKNESGQDRFIAWLYESRIGNIILPILVRPFVSKLGGKVLDSRLSCVAIKRFIRNNGIDMSQFEVRKFTSYNDFFTRRIKPEARIVCTEPDALISPCDCVLSVYPIADDSRFEIKGTSYTLSQLLKDEYLTQQFTGGTLLLFRLSVTDYHRYCYPASGTKSSDTLIPGVFHTVNPLAAAMHPIYKENTRIRTVIATEEFGDVLMMEVGALMVGKIVNDKPWAGKVKKGQEKGRFEFGGSTIILCLQKNAAAINPAFFLNTQQGIETPVQYGQKIGSSTRNN